jgi:hypothetical protein
MFALRMVRLIETRAEQLSGELIHRLEASHKCSCLLRKVHMQELKNHASEIYRNLHDWLTAKTQSEIEQRYAELGTRRARQQVPLSELLFAFSATKECLWEHLEQDGLFEDPMELIGDLNLLHSIGRFFDGIAHAAAVGYERARPGDVDERTKRHSAVA